MQNTEQEFKSFLADRSVILDRPLIMDGSLQRFPLEGKTGNRDAWFVIYNDEDPLLIGGNWHTGEEYKFKPVNRNRFLPQSKKATVDRRIAEARQKRDKELRRTHDETAKEAAREWEQAKPAPEDHPYLLKKQIRAHNIRLIGEGLAVAVMNALGEVRSIQTIAPDGQKRFRPGGEVHGNFFSIPGDDAHMAIGEGYATMATIHECTGWTCICAFNAGNLPGVAKKIRGIHPEAMIVITADDDRWTPGNPGLTKGRKAAVEINGTLLSPKFEDLSSKPTDFNDLAVKEGADALREQLTRFAESQNQRPRYVALGIHDFLQYEFPPRHNLLSPWLPEQGLVMVYAYRGVGKTHFALGVAYAVVSGGSFLGWEAQNPSGVLYIDGEMPGPVIQERVAQIVANAEKEPGAPFILLTPDLQPEGMPRIDTEEGQVAIESFLTDEIKLIVVDNLSTLSGAKENEADGWTPIQAWALRQRARGRSVLFIHHSGKTGAQRGTSRREDVLDTVIALRRPVDYNPEQGAVFETHFEKARGLYGDAVKPVEATLITDDQGRTSWSTRTVEDSTFDLVLALLNEGVRQNDIATELNINKSTVSRHAKKAKSAGLIEFKKKEVRHG